MKNKKIINPGSSRQFVKIVITLIAMINLVLLFFFDYRVPGCAKFISMVESNRTKEADDMLEIVLAHSAESEAPVEIVFKKAKLTYSGKDKLDLNKGVSVTDENGNSLSLKYLTTTIEDTKKKEKKKIIYSFADDSGRVAEAERSLILKDYEGAPKVSIDEDTLPDLTDISEDYLKATYLQYVVAEDGFGNDISRSAEITLEEDPDQGDGHYLLTFTLTNQVGDSTVVQYSKEYHPTEEE